jgi:hypothetical protein
MSQAYTISTLIDDLRALYNEHGDVPVFDAHGRELFGWHIELATYDDWDNATETPEGDIPAVGVAVSIGRK